MRTIVVVSDQLAYVGPVALADFSPRPPGVARVVMDAFVARYRNAGWRVLDHRCDAASAA
ncbi:MAG TPA: hypothetical protein VG370_25675 [Chloroflexota bacterium]|nr:hypothetical protein [Chloroflexota bacterium]